MYRGSSGNWQSDLRRRFVMAGIPATLTIIGLAVTFWFLAIIAPGVGLFQLLVFHSQHWPLPFPWTIATWPIAGGGHPLFFLFALLWTYSMCGSLERSWGTRTFTLFFVATNALTALTYLAGGALLHTPVMLFDLWTGVAAPTVAWCLLNRREQITLWGLLPIPAMWLAGLEVVIVWFEHGPPFLGLFALSGCAAAYWYVTQGRYGSSGFGNDSRNTFRSPFSSSTSRSRESSGPGFSLARLLRDRREKRRLEDLFRRSGYDDRDKR